MRLRTTLTLVPLTLLGGLIALAPAQDPPPSKLTTRPPAGAESPKAPAGTEPQKPKRTLYPVQHGDATAIAEAVGRLFRDEATVLPAPTGNAILISGLPASVEEVVKMIDQLDRAPRSVEVEITLVEVPRKDGTELTPADLATAATQAKAGQRITLVAVEGQPITSTTGGNKPVVSGTMVGGGGFGGAGGGGPPVRKSITYQNVGTTVQMTARVGEKDAISLDVSIQDSKIKPPAADDDTGATSMDSVSLTTKLSIPAGKSVVARAVRTSGKDGATVSAVVVTAKVVGTGVAVRTTK